MPATNPWTPRPPSCKVSTKKESFTVREETQPLKICVVCKLPITREQRPSVEMKNGDEVHAECWNEYDKARREKLN